MQNLTCKFIILHNIIERSGIAKDANIEPIRRAIGGFNWQKTFSDKNVNEKVDTFNKTILSLLSNFIPKETITCVVEIHHGLIMKSNPLYTKKIQH